MEPARRRPDQTREALLAAGSELFADHGFDGVTTEQIARRAGVNKALISYHFGGKAKLHAAIVKDILGPAAIRFTELSGQERPARDLLRELIGTYVEAVTRRPALPRMVLREIIAGGGRMLDPEVLAYVQALLQAVVRIVERGVSEGAFRSVSPVHVHLTLVGSLNVFFGSIPFRTRLHEAGVLPAPPESDPRPFAEHLAEVLIRGLAAPGSPA